jgi:hypothetical protein
MRKLAVLLTVLLVMTSGALVSVAANDLSQGSTGTNLVNGSTVIDASTQPGAGVTQINNAIKTAGAKSPSSVLISKSYTLSGSILMDQAGVTLQCTNNAHLTLANGVTKDMIYISAPNTRVTGCTLDGNRTNQTRGYGIKMYGNLNHIDIDHNQILNTYDSAITGNNVSYLRIESNRIVNCSRAEKWAIEIAMNSRATSESNYNIEDNDIDQSSSQSSGINVACGVPGGSIKYGHIDRNRIIVGDAGATITIGIQLFTRAGANVSNFTVDRNVITGADKTNTNAWGITLGLIGVEAADSTIRGNTIRDTRSDCIESGMSGVIISGNLCDDTIGIQIPADGVIGDGITVTENTLTNGVGTYGQIGVSGIRGYFLRHVVISNNRIYNCPPTSRAIFFNGNPTGEILDSEISGNVIVGQTSGMRMPAIHLNHAANVSVHDNKLQDWNGPVHAIQIEPTSRGTQVKTNSYKNVSKP